MRDAESYFNSDISDMGAITYPCEYWGHRSLKLYISPYIQYLKIRHDCTFQPSKVVVLLDVLLDVLLVDFPIDYPVT